MKKEYYIIITLIVIIILLFTCNKPEIQTEKVEVIRVDSVFTQTTDTIEKVIKMPMASVEIHDTVYLYGDVHKYVFLQNDSLYDAKIEVDAACYPEDVRLDLTMRNYTIRDTFNIYVRDSVYHEARKSSVAVGAFVTGNQTHFGLSPMVEYNHKKGNSYKLGYDIINGHVMFGFSKTLRFK